MRSLIFFSALFLLLSFLRCQPPLVGAEPPAAPLVFTPALVYDSARHWVDSVYLSMSEEERIARLFWLAVEQVRSEEHTSELQSRPHLVCRLLLEKKKEHIQKSTTTCAHFSL